MSRPESHSSYWDYVHGRNAGLSRDDARSSVWYTSQLEPPVEERKPIGPWPPGSLVTDEIPVENWPMPPISKSANPRSSLPNMSVTTNPTEFHVDDTLQDTDGSLRDNLIAQRHIDAMRRRTR